MNGNRPIPVETLSREAFAPFGDVIDTEGAAERRLINDGHCTRFHDLAALDLTGEGGRPLVNIFRSTAWEMPLRVSLVEKHTLGSQAFIPMGNIRFLIIVAPPGEAVSANDLRAFVGNGRQGVNYRPGVWHHPLVALAEEADFLVIDRGAPETDCIEHVFTDDERRSVSLGEC